MGEQAVWRSFQGRRKGDGAMKFICHYGTKADEYEAGLREFGECPWRNMTQNRALRGHEHEVAFHSCI